jgi:hypothetical protein
MRGRNQAFVIITFVARATASVILLFDAGEICSTADSGFACPAVRL